jgi:hypothetical protein
MYYPSFMIHFQDVEVIAVLICGLNDWRAAFERFPFGPGPGSFKTSLSRLVEEIKAEVASPLRIYLPA